MLLMLAECAQINGSDKYCSIVRIFMQFCIHVANVQGLAVAFLLMKYARI